MEEKNNLHIEELKETMRIVFSKIPKQQWRFFHKKSLENFVYYLPKIKGRTEKEEIIQAINNYLSVIDTDFQEQIDMSLGKELFETYLYPVARNYEWRQGFIPISSIRGLIFLVPLILFFLWLIYLVNEYAFYILGGTLLLYIFRMIVKIKQRKAYGLGY